MTGRKPQAHTYCIQKHEFDAAVCDISKWIVHTGGYKVVQTVMSYLELTEEDLNTTIECLKNYGNLSSAAVMFVYHMSKAHARPSELAIMIGIGPGVTCEAILIKYA